jgi:primosomal protein N' (replication factor Y)
MADAARNGVGFADLLGGDDDGGETAERRHGGFPAGLSLGGVKARCVAGDERGDHRRVRIVRLHQDAPGLISAPGAAGHLVDLLEAALRGRHRQRLLVHARRSLDVQDVIREWLAGIDWSAKVRVSVDVDPYSFL